MNRPRCQRKKFCLLMGTYLLLIMLDGLLTYIHTPDLALEGNPLVAYFGLGWVALFIANFIAILLVGAAADYTFCRYKTIVTKVENRREYLSQLYFGRPDKFYQTFYRLPKNWKPIWAMAGYAIINAMIIGRAVLVLEWAVSMPPAYHNLCRMMPFGRLDLVLAMVVYVISISHWVSKEYLISRTNYTDA